MVTRLAPLSRLYTMEFITDTQRGQTPRGFGLRGVHLKVRLTRVDPFTQQFFFFFLSIQIHLGSYGFEQEYKSYTGVIWDQL